MRNFKIILQYEGTRYQGWQRQDSTQNTIQGKLEAILAKMTGTDFVQVNGSGRTDAGVHALGQVAADSMRNKKLMYTVFGIRQFRVFLSGGMYMNSQIHLTSVQCRRRQQFWLESMILRHLRRPKKVKSQRSGQLKALQ